MVLGIVAVSDTNAFKRMFGREPVYAEPESLIDLSFDQKLNEYLRNSSHDGLVHQLNKNYMRESTLIMVEHENNDTARKSASVHVNVSEDVLPNYDVHIFYYPWYGNPTHDGVYLHWNHQVLPHWKPDISARYPVGQRHRPPDDIGSSFYPKLGPYSSRDPLVIDDHMMQIRQSGAGYFHNY